MTQEALTVSDQDIILNVNMAGRHSKPRKKRRVYINREPPFPVPIATITGENAEDSTWFYYSGELHGNHVVVKHSGDMDFLYRMGFFGKGSLSKSKPEYHTGAKTADVPGESGEITRVRVLSRRSYIHHKKWKYLDPQNMDDCCPDSSLVEYDSSEEIGSLEEMTSVGNPYNDIIDQDEAFQQDQEQLRPDLETSHKDTGDNGEEFWDYKQTGSLGQDREDDWAETDEEFWGCGTTKQSDTESKTDCENDITSNNVLSIESESTPSQKESGEDDMTSNNVLSIESESTLSQKESNGDTITEDTEKFSLDRWKNINETIVDKSRPSGPHFMQKNMLSNSDQLGKICNSSKTDKTENVSISHAGSVNKDSGIQENKILSHNATDISNKCDKTELERPLDPLCEEDEEDGDVLVVEDSDSETESRYRKISKHKWLPVLKRDNYIPKEFLLLSLEESFFLSYGLGCLLVEEQGTTLDICEMWTRFCESQHNFVPNYIVYHYFRSMGWVPKSGIKFGTDFILYKEGPPFYHGSYSVVVRMVDERELEVNPEVTQRTLSWTSLAGLNRVTEHVAKELMLCYVIRPTDLSDQELKTPKCISRFKVQQIIVSRWIPSQERQEKTVEEIP